MKTLIQILVFLLLCYSILFSQEELAFLKMEELGGKVIPKSLLNKISIHIDNEPLEMALLTIAEKGGIDLNYSQNKMPLHKHVSLHKENVYALEALLTVLKKTGTILKITQSGRLAIVPHKESNQNSDNFREIIRGTVNDSQSGEPLPGANITIKGMAIGAVSDLEGNFNILNVPVRKFILQISFIGYKSKEIPITVMPGESVSVDVSLDFDVIKFNQSVVVTAQLEGQAASINQQLRSNTIVNVVSKDKIQELPDQNAAESLGRLPGIAIQRSGGEGQKVVVRGLSPRFSAVTVNGERLPGSSDDRSVDLSLISPDVLAGIEVYKALRPDIDADAVGGSINFITKKAPKGGSQFTLRLFGGYNGLENDYGNYKGSFSYSDRYFYDYTGDSKLGFLATGSIQRANRSSDILSGGYDWINVVNNENIYRINSVRLSDRKATRDRYSLNLVVDYHPDINHNIVYSSLWGRTDNDSQTMSHNYIVLEKSNVRSYDERIGELHTWSNSLAGEHLIGGMQLNWRGSYSTMLSKCPWYTHFEFRELDAFDEDMQVGKVNPLTLPTFAKNNAATSWLDQTWIGNSKLDDRHLTGQLDIKYPIQLGSNISGYLKVGGKIRDKRREKDVNEWGGHRWATAQRINQFYDDLFIDVQGSDEDIALVNFIDKNKKKYEGFLNGNYDFIEILDSEKLHWFATTFDSIYKDYTDHKWIEANDYIGSETITAAYVMTEFNWKRKIMLMPGIRYEKTSTDYSTKWITNAGDLGTWVQPAFKDTLGNRIYENYLPMLHLRVKPVKWFDIRLASTRSISRPDFYNLIPYELIRWEVSRLTTGNPNLKETTAMNYDATLSFYNRYGLFTVGTFYKELKNIDYIRSSKRTDGYYSPYLPDLKGWVVTNPENLENMTTVKGWEFELHTNFKFLPNPLDGIVLYANFSQMRSKTHYPFTIFEQEFITKPPYVVLTTIDSARVGRMLGQVDKIANLTLGYEKGGFSGRLSMIYQGDALQGVGMAEENDSITDAFVRWDFVMQQRIFKGFKFIAQVNNIANHEEKSLIRYKEYPTRREYYGRTIDLGLQFEY